MLNKKLGFYNSVRGKFGIEEYIKEDISYKKQQCLAQLRMSAHKLKIETGRYLHNRKNTISRACRTRMENAQLLSELPFYDLLLEDEPHVLLTCTKYHDIRLSQDHALKTGLFADLRSLFRKEKNGKIRAEAFQHRFPELMKVNE